MGGVIVCLRAEPWVILQRIGTDDRRPLLEGQERLARIRELLEMRAAAYARADLSIDTSTSNVEEVVDQIVRHLCLRPDGTRETG